MIGAARAQPLLDVPLDFPSVRAIGQPLVEVHFHNMPPVALRTFNSKVRPMLNHFLYHFSTPLSRQ